MKRLSTRSIAVYAVTMALTMVATYAIKFPTPATNGYANLGDAFVLFSGVVFGPIPAFFIGGGGSALADLAGGYAHWILPTFIIKGTEGAVAGLLFILLKKTKLNRFINAGIVSFIGAILMIAGYFTASTIMKGSAAVALTSVPANCVQGSVGVVVNVIILVATYKIKGFGSLVGKNCFYDAPYTKTSKTVPEKSITEVENPDDGDDTVS